MLKDEIETQTQIGKISVSDVLADFCICKNVFWQNFTDFAVMVCKYYIEDIT